MVTTDEPVIPGHLVDEVAAVERVESEPCVHGGDWRAARGVPVVLGKQWHLVVLSTDSSVAIMVARDPAYIFLQASRTLLEVLLTSLVCQSVSMSASMGLLTARCAVLTLSFPGGVKSDRTAETDDACVI
jgi:hypothetical protein